MFLISVLVSSLRCAVGVLSCAADSARVAAANPRYVLRRAASLLKGAPRRVDALPPEQPQRPTHTPEPPPPADTARAPSYVARIASESETRELGTLVRLMKRHRVIGALRDVGVGREDGVWAVRGAAATVEIRLARAEVCGIELALCEPADAALAAADGDSAAAVVAAARRVRRAANITFAPITADRLTLSLTAAAGAARVCVSDYAVLIQRTEKVPNV